jgi:hypothetical protein
MRRLFNSIFRLISSYALAVTLFVLLFFLILFGTLYQVDNGLYQAQKQYFESAYVIHHIGPVAIPLPGGYALLAAFGVALLGAMLRVRKTWNRAGILIAHVGVVVMLVSSGITFHFSDRGHMQLFPAQQSDEFASYHDWNIEIGKPASGATLHLIPDTLFRNLDRGGPRTFESADLPFDLVVGRFAVNGVPVPPRAPIGGDAPVVDGYRLASLPPEKEAELNTPGVYVSVKDKAGGETTEGILWGLDAEPLTVKSGDTYYTIGLERKRFRVPFTVYLDEFKADFHPGTAMASAYEAHITKKEGGKEEKIRIWMNHPLRDRGYTFFQASYGPPNAGPGDTLYTVFEVVRNPADQGPLVACIIVGAGLLIHFTRTLVGHMRAEGRRRAA